MRRDVGEFRDPGPTYETIEEITCRFITRPGVERRREISKTIVSKTSTYVTILFAFQDYAKGRFDKVRWSLQRWRWYRGRWRKTSGVSFDETTFRKVAAELKSGKAKKLALALGRKPTFDVEVSRETDSPPDT